MAGASECPFPRALLIFNPVAGGAHGGLVAERAASQLRASGWQVDLAGTDAASGARTAARRGIAAGYNVLIACGGDGTLGQIAGEVAAAAARPAVALVPCGTANVFARELGLPLRPLAAARLLPRLRPRAAPLGRARFANEATAGFSCFASAGFDAHVLATLTPAQKRRWGVAAFLGVGLRQLWRYPFPPVTVLSGDGAGPPARAPNSLAATLAVCTLTRYYAGPFPLYPRSLGTGPRLIVCAGGPAWRWAQLACFSLRAFWRAPGVRVAAWSGGTVRWEGDAPLQLDGDAVGRLPVELEILPDAFTVLAP